MLCKTHTAWSGLGYWYSVAFGGFVFSRVVDSGSRYGFTSVMSAARLEPEFVGTRPPNEVTSADGGRRVPFASVAQWPTASEFLR